MKTLLFSLQLPLWIFAGIVLVLITLNGCSDDDETIATPSPDTTPPTISLTASQIMIRTSSPLVLTATASDLKKLYSVTFFDNGVELFVDNETPYEFSMDMTHSDNRLHTCKAVATDAAGNEGESDEVEVIVYIDPQVGFVNGGFDTGTEGWELLHFDQWSGWSESAGNPPGCMQINEFGSCEVDPGVTQLVDGLMAGIGFSVSGQYRPYVNWIGNPALESFVVTVDSVVVGSFARGPNGDAWSNFSVEFTASELAHTIGFWAEYNCDDSSYEMDNVVIVVAE